jgi:hypothetical protein
MQEREQAHHADSGPGIFRRASVLLPASARLSCLIDPVLGIDHWRSFSGAFQFQLS